MNSSKTNNSIIKRLLESFQSYYNIVTFDDESYLVARCDYFEKSEKFMVSKKANLWSANAEEFIYLFYAPNLTENIYDECMKLVAEAWPKEAHIGPDHMYTYVTPIFVCEDFEPAAAKKLKKCRIYKSFKLSFYGWMEYHTALICSKTEGDSKEWKLLSNPRGACVKKMVLKVLDIK
ncbi:MAG: hypothetical protein MJ182_01055 [Treponema sp.]|nr:hypothetical protein [Treponema sp.]